MDCCTAKRLLKELIALAILAVDSQAPTNSQQGGGAGDGLQQVRLPGGAGVIVGVRRQQRVHHHRRRRQAPYAQVARQLLPRNPRVSKLVGF